MQRLVDAIVFEICVILFLLVIARYQPGEDEGD